MKRRASQHQNCRRQRGRTCAALLALCGVLGAAAMEAVALDGRYKLTESAQCDAANDLGLLRIEDGVLYGAESRCRMTNRLDIRDMNGALFDMICIGEGSGWEERAILVQAASGGLILVWDGYAFEYEACPKPPVRPRPRPE
ncbi:MAG: hypothetical protein AAF646_04255 [Pseudomonadota bacterium]